MKDIRVGNGSDWGIVARRFDCKFATYIKPLDALAARGGEKYGS